MARPAGLGRTHLALVAAAAAFVATRVLAFSLTTLGFTEHATQLAPASWDASAAAVAAGLALGGYGLTMALAQLAGGMLSDRVGRRAVLAGGTLLFVAGGAVCALAGDVRVLLAGRLLMGLGGVASVALAAVGESVPEARRTTAMALIGAPAGLAVFLGFLLGPALAPALGFRGLFWLAAGLGAVAGLPFLLRPLPMPRQGLAAAAPARHPALLGLGLAGLASGFTLMPVMYGFASSVLPLLGRAGLAVALGGGLAGMALASRAADGRPWGARAALLAALALLAAAAPAFRLAQAPPAAIAAGAAFFAAHATLAAVLPSQVSRLAGRQGGRGHGAQMLHGHAGTFLGGVAAGALAGHPALLFAAAGVLCAAAAAWLALHLRAPAAAAHPAPA